MEPPIKDFVSYNEKMKKTIIDKIFFMDKIEVERIVDFGCADGALISFLANMFPEIEYVGYDIDPKMIELANEKSNLDNVLFTSDIKDINSNKKETALLLSSVIHEVYSQKKDINGFWESVWGLDFKYVVIRDMMHSRTMNRPSNNIHVARIRQVYDPVKINQWESQWGTLEENWSLIHFLLTFTYEENWDRELRENYLPINLESLLNLIPNHYYPKFFEHYTLPYINQISEEKFGIQIPDRTHLKLILEKRSFNVR